MRELIKNDTSKCIGCNRCIRTCPVEGANIGYNEGKEIKVKIDYHQCIVCGSCIEACQHASRTYYDDTEKFLSDLKAGTPISMFAAPANRTNGENWGKLLTWLRQNGVKKIYDVSLGADICTWAHIRYIQKENPKSLITQPCPAIVNYILMYNHTLLSYLSPIHSPMLCTAVYMKQYEKINDKIAALSPCIAKSHEFDATNYVNYNVTFKKLYEYIKRNKIKLPPNETGFDHVESSLGCLYSMPGGLKENVELYLGKTLRIDKSEGPGIVYKALNEFSKQKEKYLPAIFDVLNCSEGCNLGTGCEHNRDIFEINYIMNNARQNVLKSYDMDAFNNLYNEYDRILRLTDFIRIYTPMETRSYVVNNSQIEQAFSQLGKKTKADREINCSACGHDTCLIMAKKIACGLNIPDNCIHKLHDYVLELSATNLENLKKILEYISKIRELSEKIHQSISDVDITIKKYNEMAKEIGKIATQINLISLNASIEAARAGQNGKAFSVIAEAIRGLANSSKDTVSETGQIAKYGMDSIKKINVIIDQIITEIENSFQEVTNISEKTESILKKDES